MANQPWSEPTDETTENRLIKQSLILVMKDIPYEERVERDRLSELHCSRHQNDLEKSPSVEEHDHTYCYIYG